MTKKILTILALALAIIFASLPLKANEGENNAPPKFDWGKLTDKQKEQIRYLASWMKYQFVKKNKELEKVVGRFEQIRGEAAQVLTGRNELGSPGVAEQFERSEKSRFYDDVRLMHVLNEAKGLMLDTEVLEMNGNFAKQFRQMIENSPLWETVITPHIEQEFAKRTWKEGRVGNFTVSLNLRRHEGAKVTLKDIIVDRVVEFGQTIILYNLAQVISDTIISDTKDGERDAESKKARIGSLAQDIIFSIAHAKHGLLARELSLIDGMYDLLKMEKGILGRRGEKVEYLVEEIFYRYSIAGNRFHQRRVLSMLAETNQLYKDTIRTAYEIRTKANKATIGAMKWAGFYPAERKLLRAGQVVPTTAMFFTAVFTYQVLKAKVSGNPLFIEQYVQSSMQAESWASFAVFSLSAATVGMPLQTLHAAAFLVATGQETTEAFANSPAWSKWLMKRKFGQSLVNKSTRSISGYGKALFRAMGNLSLIVGVTASSIATNLWTLHHLLPKAKRESLEKIDQRLLAAKTVGEMEKALKERDQVMLAFQRFEQQQNKGFYGVTGKDIAHLLLSAELANVSFQIAGGITKGLGNGAEKLVSQGVQRFVFKPALIDEAVATGVWSKSMGRQAMVNMLSAADTKLAAELLLKQGLIDKGLATAARRGLIRFALGGAGRALTLFTSDTPLGITLRMLTTITLVAIPMFTTTTRDITHTVVFFGWLDITEQSIFKSWETAKIVNKINRAKAEYEKLSRVTTFAVTNPAEEKNIERALKHSVKTFNSAAALHRANDSYRQILSQQIKDSFLESQKQLVKKYNDYNLDFKFINWLLSGAKKDKEFLARYFNWLDTEKIFYPVHPCYEYTAGIDEEKLEHVFIPPSEIFELANERLDEEQGKFKRDWFLYLLYKLEPQFFAQFNEQDFTAEDIPESWDDKLTDRNWFSRKLTNDSKYIIKQLTKKLPRGATEEFNLVRFLKARQNIRKYSNFPYPYRIKKYPVKLKVTTRSGPYDVNTVEVNDLSVTEAKMNRQCLESWKILEEENKKFISSFSPSDPELMELVIKEEKAKYEEDLAEITRVSQEAIDGALKQLFSARKLRPGQGQTSGFYESVKSWGDAIARVAYHVPKAALEAGGTIFGVSDERDNYNYVAHHSNLYAFAENLPMNIVESYAEEFNYWAEEVGYLLSDPSLTRWLKDDLFFELKRAFVSERISRETPEATLYLLQRTKNAIKQKIARDILPRLKANREKLAVDQSSYRLPRNDIITGCLVLEQLIPSILDNHWASGSRYAYSLESKLALNKSQELGRKYKAEITDEQNGHDPYSLCLKAAYGKDYLTAEKEETFGLCQAPSCLKPGAKEGNLIENKTPQCPALKKFFGSAELATAAEIENSQQLQELQSMQKRYKEFFTAIKTYHAEHCLRREQLEIRRQQLSTIEEKIKKLEQPKGFLTSD